MRVSAPHPRWLLRGRTAMSSTLANDAAPLAAQAPPEPARGPPAGGLSSMHFVAGALGGAAGSVVTCPFDLVKTRLQSDAFRTPDRLAHRSSSGVARALWHFVETGQILRWAMSDFKASHMAHSCSS